MRYLTVLVYALFVCPTANGQFNGITPKCDCHIQTDAEKRQLKGPVRSWSQYVYGLSDTINKDKYKGYRHVFDKNGHITVERDCQRPHLSSKVEDSLDNSVLDQQYTHAISGGRYNYDTYTEARKIDRVGIAPFYDTIYTTGLATKKDRPAYLVRVYNQCGQDIAFYEVFESEKKDAQKKPIVRRELVEKLIYNDKCKLVTDSCFKTTNCIEINNRYDDQGNLIISTRGPRPISTIYSDSVWYKYDSDNRVIEERGYNNSMLQYSNTSRYLTFDKYGNWTKKIDDYWNNTESARTVVITDNEIEYFSE